MCHLVNEHSQLRARIEKVAKKIAQAGGSKPGIFWLRLFPLPDAVLRQLSYCLHPTPLTLSDLKLYPKIVAQTIWQSIKSHNSGLIEL